MKQKITTYIISLGLLVSIFTSQTSFVFAQNQNAGASALYGYPSNAALGATAEARAAYNALTEAQKADAAATIQQLIADATDDGSHEPGSINLSFTGDVADDQMAINADAKKSGFSGFSNGTASDACADCGIDNDADGLHDKLEAGLANGFTPIYHVSAGENPGTGFARFLDSVPQTVDLNQPIQVIPPISHYRVKPLGIFTRVSDGLRYGLIQINYMTLWNRDDGLVASGFCPAYPIINLTNLLNHPLDNEWTAILVAAPVVNGGYDPIKANYKMYEVFTAAHQGVQVFDQSMYFSLATPVSIDNHLNLFFAKSKHGTYVFNPDYYPITQAWVIFSVYAALAYMYATSQINWWEYIAYLALANDFFFACVIERFQEQGGLYADANKRINVGELTHPINSSRFIQDTALSNQLSLLFY
jgi:hypothetical protein